MVRYNLSNGKTVLLTMEQYLAMDDLKEQELLASGRGVEINNPFADFSITSQNDDEEFIELEEIPDEEIKTILNEFNSEEDNEEEN